MSSYFILGLGLFLIFLEFFLPGGIIGAFGGILLFISVIVFANEAHSLLSISLYVLSIFILLALLVKLAIVRIKATKKTQSIYSDDSQDGFFASEYDKTSIGKVGVVLTDLKPGGYILLDLKKEQAISVEGYIPKGCSVTVIGGQEESLLVKLYKG